MPLFRKKDSVGGERLLDDLISETKRKLASLEGAHRVV